mmetsp:Transcript_45028/g.101656  ORF Transcript_45028/g.101656 Transcript_45028/m.101656 type:complete len:225 (+) Transcript_45028:427-1101(+)
MVDQLLDWEDDLPERDFDLAEESAAKSAEPKGLAICLGTSMQMTPARDWPCEAGRMVIVNLQPTVKDAEAKLVIRAPIDTVMRGLVQGLEQSRLEGPSQGLEVPRYERAEAFALSHRFESPRGRGDDWSLQIADETGSPCGFILHVTVANGQETVTLERQPFRHRGRGRTTLQVTVHFDRIPLGDGRFYRRQPMMLTYEVAAAEGRQVFTADLTTPLDGPAGNC